MNVGPQLVAVQTTLSADDLDMMSHVYRYCLCGGVTLLWSHSQHIPHVAAALGMYTFVAWQRFGVMAASLGMLLTVGVALCWHLAHLHS